MQILSLQDLLDASAFERAALAAVTVAQVHPRGDWTERVATSPTVSNPVAV
jgi:hypothetical protein